MRVLHCEDGFQATVAARFVPLHSIQRSQRAAELGAKPCTMRISNISCRSTYDVFFLNLFGFPAFVARRSWKFQPDQYLLGNRISRANQLTSKLFSTLLEFIWHYERQLRLYVLYRHVKRLSPPNAYVVFGFLRVPFFFNMQFFLVSR